MIAIVKELERLRCEISRLQSERDEAVERCATMEEAAGAFAAKLDEAVAVIKEIRDETAWEPTIRIAESFLSRIGGAK